MDQTKDRDEGSDVTQAQEPVQLDFYGVKVRLTPSNVPKDMPDPGSWLEVAKRVHQDLKAIAGGVIRLLRVTVESATNLIAGIGALPQAFTRKVDKAHAKGDDLEIANQISSTAISPKSSANAASGKIRHLLNKKALAGNSVGITFDESDSIIVLYTLKPGAEESLPQLMNVIGSTLRKTGGLVSSGTEKSDVWLPATVQFRNLFAYLYDHRQSEIAEALRPTRLSITGSHLIISCTEQQQLDHLKSCLGSFQTKQIFQSALIHAFGQELSWALILDEVDERSR